MIVLNSIAVPLQLNSNESNGLILRDIESVAIHPIEAADRFS